ncbi:unnamed protein product, partial [Ectocarpus fasciculatus]
GAGGAVDEEGGHAAGHAARFAAPALQQAEGGPEVCAVPGAGERGPRLGHDGLAAPGVPVQPGRAVRGHP